MRELDHPEAQRAGTQDAHGEPDERLQGNSCGGDVDLSSGFHD